MAVYTILVCTLLFASAGTVRWPSAWAWIVFGGIAQIITMRVVGQRHPDLLVERSRLQTGTKKWDKIIAPLLVVVGPFIMFVCAGLDYRWHGLRFPMWVTMIGLAAALVGAAVTGAAMYTNRFFSSTVRIQTERGHAVVSSGPYGLVRHPGYVGMLLAYLAMPVMLGSVWALTPAVLTAMLLVLRTALEDRTLRMELPGYADYADTVRYRLLPGVW